LQRIMAKKLRPVLLIPVASGKRKHHSCLA